MRLWRFEKEDLAAALFILLLPLAVAAPRLFGGVVADPLVYGAEMAVGLVPGVLPGVPTIDPNSGLTTQALGTRAALDWIEGRVPWWNPYSGVGLPLAAEYQPAAFFPPILLLLLPNGMAWLQVFLQVLSGWGTYVLLRQLGAGRLAATVAGLLYAFNGTLAWFAHSAALPVPFLPWMLVGIERARARSAARLPGGWRLFAAAMALNLLAGFPETAYISGLLALAWAIVRGLEAERGVRGRYALKIACGGVVGIALAAPQVLAFLLYLPQAFIGGHADMSLAALEPPAIILAVLAPYAFGPIFAFYPQWPLLANIWGGIGGYATALLAIAALHGFLSWRSPLRWVLLAWCVLAIAKSFRIEPALSLWNLVPGVSIAAFTRYVPPSWELALVILAAKGLDSASSRPLDRRAWWALLGVATFALGAGLVYGALTAWPHMREQVRFRNWGIGSATWAILTVAAFLLLTRFVAPRWRTHAFAVLLVIDAVFMFAIPTLSHPRAGAFNVAAIQFLRDNLGLHRFYTLGPIQPNFGALLGLASINHNYLPVSQRWVDWVHANLDRGADPVVFNGHFGRARGLPSALDELRANLGRFEALGVRYVVARADEKPFTGMVSPPRRVYSDPTIVIYELEHPAPYFESPSKACVLAVASRTEVTADCAAPEKIVRRELYFPGWRATLGSTPAPIAEHDGLFQAVAVPAGKSRLRFDYAPPHITWAWLAALIALAVWVFPSLRRRAAA